MRLIKKTLLLTILLLQSSCYLFSIQQPDRFPFTELQQKYAISLTDGWTAKEADLLLDIFDSIYQKPEEPKHHIKPSVWKISDEDLQDDVQTEFVKGVKHVTISRDVFSVEVSEVESEEVSLSNERLFPIVAEFVTENWTNIPEVRRILKDGTDRDVIELVLKEMYGLSIISAGMPEIDKIGQELRKNGSQLRLSQPTNEELMMLVSVYEKFPKGLHNIGAGLKYLLINQQRAYAGYAWIGLFCVEYADFVFYLNRNEFKRIIIHEKAHFLWENTLNWDLRAEWAKIGGWQKDEKNRFGWSNARSPNEFVTPYARFKNPNEDWSESVAYYLFQPDRLRSCSPPKYEFIDKVMKLYSKRETPYRKLTLKTLENHEISPKVE